MIFPLLPPLYFPDPPQNENLFFHLQHVASPGHSLHSATRQNLIQMSFPQCSLQIQPQITNGISAKFMCQHRFPAKSLHQHHLHQLGSSQTFLELPPRSQSIILDLLLPLGPAPTSEPIHWLSGPAKMKHPEARAGMLWLRSLITIE